MNSDAFLHIIKEILELAAIIYGGELKDYDVSFDYYNSIPRVRIVYLRNKKYEEQLLDSMSVFEGLLALKNKIQQIKKHDLLKQKENLQIQLDRISNQLNSITDQLKTLDICNTCQESQTKLLNE